jgi:hypothetical protein
MPKSTKKREDPTRAGAPYLLGKPYAVTPSDLRELVLWPFPALFCGHFFIPFKTFNVVPRY